MNLVDFIIGGLLANAMPHFIMGITNTRFMGLFGFSSKGNIAYAVLQFVVSIILLIANYGVAIIWENGFVAGPVAVLVIFFILGKTLVKVFAKKE